MTHRAPLSPRRTNHEPWPLIPHMRVRDAISMATDVSTEIVAQYPWIVGPNFFECIWGYIMTTMVWGCEWKCGCIVSAQAYIYLKPVCVRVCLCVHLETAGSKGSLCGWKYLCHPSFLLHSLQTTPLLLTKFPLPCFTCMHSDPRSAYGIETWKTLKNFQMKTCAPLLGSFGNTTQQISFSRVFIIPRVNCVNGSFLWNNFVMTSGTIKITDQSPFGHFVLA